MIEIKNGRIVTPNEIIENKSIFIENGVISEIGDHRGTCEKTINAHGRYILPGFIDVHSDRIEKFISPRATAVFDYELALKECEKELLQLGITTIYHSISMYGTDVFGQCPLRSKESVERLAALIADIHRRNHLIHHRFHLRVEIDYIEAYDIAKEMMEQGLIHEISFMDHTPGQGQYRNLEIYEKSIDTTGMTFDEILEQNRTKTTLSAEQLKELADIAHSKGITVASHDDDTVDKLRLNERIGVDISEFPITIDVAKAAHKQGYYTVIGAPNILLGGSHSGNMSAAEAIMEDCGDILCSDYYPQALLHSIFVMHEKYGKPLPEMVNKATLNPAKAMKLDGEYGSIEVGKKADLSIVEILDGYPVITHVLVDGKTTSRVEYRR